jgi:hypothetical protein
VLELIAGLSDDRHHLVVPHITVDGCTVVRCGAMVREGGEGNETSRDSYFQAQRLLIPMYYFSTVFFTAAIGTIRVVITVVAWCWSVGIELVDR